MSNKLVTPLAPQTITSNGLAITLTSTAASFQVSVPATGVVSSPTRSLTSPLSISTELADHLGLSGDQLEQAIAGADLEFVGSVKLDAISQDDSIGLQVPYFSADQQLIAVKYVGGQAQFIRQEMQPVTGAAATPQSTTFSIPVERTPTTAPVAVGGMHTLSLNLLSAAEGVIVKIFKYVGDKVVAGTAKLIEHHFKTEQPLRCDTGHQLEPVTPDYLGQLGTQPTLLLVHGIFSTIKDGFHGLLSDPSTMQGLTNKYKNRIIGWDHRTASESTADNAIALIAALPDGTQLDVVCHSRGGLVMRSLLEDPAIQQQVQAKNIVVNKVIFVAGAFAGDMIASSGDAILTALNGFIRLCSLLPQNSVVDSLGFATKLLVAVAQAVQDLPGIACLDPVKGYVATNDWTGELTAKPTYYFIRADYSPGSSFVDEVLDQAVDAAIADKQNDYVVPFDGAGLPGAAYKVADHKDILDANGGPQSRVFHTNFFYQPDVKLCLAKWL